MPVRVLATDVDTGEAVVFTRGRPARRGARLVQLPRRVPAHGARGAPARGRRASPRSSPCALAREMAGEAGVVLAVDCNAGGRWPARRLLRGHRAARRPHHAARPHAQRAGGRRPRDRALHRRVGLDAADAHPAVRAPPARKRWRRRCPSCAGSSARDPPLARRRLTVAGGRGAGLASCVLGRRAAAPRPTRGAGWRAPASSPRSSTVDGVRVRYVRRGRGPAGGAPARLRVVRSTPGRT